MGPSGSGKSTIVQLIERFYDIDTSSDHDSAILIDGINLQNLKLNEYRNQIGYVGQEPVLFNTTIRENILMGKPNASNEEIDQALRSTNAYDFVYRQPDKLDTQAGSSGS